jgi:hypothetical protein
MTFLEYAAHQIKCTFLALGFFCIGCILLVLEVTVGPRRSRRIAEWFYDKVGISLHEDGPPRG